VGDYDYYLEKKKRDAVAAARQSAAILSTNKSAATTQNVAPPKTSKPRKLSFKETRELEGIETQIHAVEADISRIEALFATSDFHRTHATQTAQLVADLAAAKEKLKKLFERWEELEAVRASSDSLAG
jgi:ATP-binding cassette subfamily F protein uup